MPRKKWLGDAAFKMKKNRSYVASVFDKEI